MDQQTNSIVAFLALGASIVASVFGVLNGHRIRSNCCGRKSSLEVEDITPKKLKEALLDDAHPFDSCPIPS